MKKVFILMSIALIFSINSFATTTQFTSAPLTTELVFEYDSNGPIPFGQERVTFQPATEEKALALYKRAFGTTDGFSFDAAQKITALYPVGFAPCWCWDTNEANRYQYTGKLCIDCVSASTTCDATR